MNQDEHKRQIDHLVTGASEALSDLISESPEVSGGSVDDQTSSGDRIGAAAEPTVDIELARMSFTPEELASARVGTIYSLGKPPCPAVAVYRGGKKIADATLFVRDGRLCLRIQNLASE